MLKDFTVGNYLEYLEEWTAHFNDVQKLCDYINGHFPDNNICKNGLFNNVSVLKQYVIKENGKE